MDWSAPIDAYCERVAEGLLGEPLNALSNFAFFVAAGYGLVVAKQHRSELAVWLLALLVAVIGLGSLLFHTFANRWSMLADIIPITIFIYSYFAFALRRFAPLSWVAIATVIAGLLVVNLAVGWIVAPGLLNGSIGYLPALVAAIGMALVLRTQHHPAYYHLAAAAVVFAFSLAFRTADRISCNALPIGTHFIWHLLNALVLGLYLEAAARYAAITVPKKN